MLKFFLCLGMYFVLVRDGCRLCSCAATLPFFEKDIVMLHFWFWFLVRVGGVEDWLQTEKNLLGSSEENAPTSEDVSQPCIVLKFIGGVENKTISDGTGDSRVSFSSYQPVGGRAFAIVARILKRLAGKFKSFRPGGKYGIPPSIAINNSESNRVWFNGHNVWLQRCYARNCDQIFDINSG